VALWVECAAAEAAEVEIAIFLCLTSEAHQRNTVISPEVGSAWQCYHVPIRSTMPVVNCIPFW
jgi:hypothetical protein